MCVFMYVCRDGGGGWVRLDVSKYSAFVYNNHANLTDISAIPTSIYTALLIRQDLSKVFHCGCHRK